MNYIKLGKLLGKIMCLEGILMIAPLLVALIYKEDFRHVLAFLVPIFLLALFGLLLQIPKPKRDTLYQKEGFALTALVWVVMTIFGALPFVINREISSFVNACFEIASGFTTTGSSIITDITTLSHSSLFWRSFSHWIGGMGILVFVLIFIPESNEGSSMHLLRAESPGPQVGKIASKMKVTARILYLIYLGLTVLEVIVLMFDSPLPGYEGDQFFFSLLTAFGCAGTGGFGFVPGSMELFSPYTQYVISIFLLLFGCNFSLYYLILLGKIGAVLRSEEFRVYIGIICGAVGLIFVSLVTASSGIAFDYSTEEAFRHSLFQVASIMTTAGFSTTDFNLWPLPAVSVLLLLMFGGGMAGSTAGGVKLSRVVIAIKGFYINVRRLVNPRYVPRAKIEGKSLEEKTINDVYSYLTLYFFFLMGVTFLLSFDPICGQAVSIASDGGEYTVTHGFFSNLSAALACLSNIGPGFEAVGAYASFDTYSIFSKILLTCTMIIGRLEILPVLILFSPKTWRKI